MLLLLGGVLLFYFLDAADFLAPKAAAFAPWKKTALEKCFEIFPCLGNKQFPTPCRYC